MAELQDPSNFITTTRRLHAQFPTKDLAQNIGFDGIQEQGDELYPQVLSALDNYHDQKPMIESSAELYELLERLFWYLHHRGLYATAFSYFSLAKNILSHERDLNLTKLAFLEGTLGTMRRNSDDAAAAIPHFRVEIALYEEAAHHGMIQAHEGRVTGAYEHMALATQQLGLYDEAFVWHEKNVKILNEYYADDVVGFALAVVNKSWALWKTGKLEEAEVCLEWVLQTAQSALDVDGKDFRAWRARAFALLVLGNVYLAQERYDDAFRVHEQAFATQVQIWGEQHFETGVLAHRMGWHMERRGEIDKAIEYFRRALRIFESAHVGMETSIIRARYKLGCVLVQYGDAREGEVLMNQARHSRQALRGIPPDLEDNMDAYDALVPYWAW